MSYCSHSKEQSGSLLCNEVLYLLTAANKPSRRGMESMKVFIIPPINEERASRRCDISGSVTALLIRVKGLGCGFRACV